MRRERHAQQIFIFLSQPKKHMEFTSCEHATISQTAIAAPPRLATGTDERNSRQKMLQIHRSGCEAGGTNTARREPELVDASQRDRARFLSTGMGNALFRRTRA
jgi:hypothetical protein